MRVRDSCSNSFIKMNKSFFESIPSFNNNSVIVLLDKTKPFEQFAVYTETVF